MIENQPIVPLLFRVDLTEEQQRQILDQTGYTIAALPFESRAPSAHIRFGGITLHVPRGVFVPTAPTERVLEAALAAAAPWPHPIMVDVGTGCGAVALAAARALPSATIYATDISDDALQAARRNRVRLEVRSVRFTRGSLLAPLPRRLRGKVSVIAANVPYVPPRLGDAFARVFPAGSAVGVGADGLGLVRDLASAARGFLAPGGSLVLQLADFQWTSFGGWLTALGYREPELLARSGRGPVAGRVVWMPRDADSDLADPPFTRSL
jgi:release factor glutamine methyltransferase